ncbi:ROK family protein [Plantactinospora sp. GCM10030261]|uniref:ROK family protein n=1 Tax=Plantactinospora sp. GCM10030261 TaxID=3273420 RepID=UPI00360E37E7
MSDVRLPVVVGLDNGGTSNNATVLDSAGRFLVDGLVETPSRVHDGPPAAVEALVAAMDAVLTATGVPRDAVLGVGLDSPGPASATGVISAKGSTNFSEPAWRGFDFRGALQDRLGLPVIYHNDGNAAALYAHHVHFGQDAAVRSSVTVVVGTGLGGGLIEQGRVVSGAAGMAGELGHVHLPLDGLLGPEQPVPTCACGFAGDAESIASLTGIARNLLPYWLTRFEGHPLAAAGPPAEAAKLVRGYGVRGDPMARLIFDQQARALGRLFTLAANFTDPHAYFVGGGVVEASPDFGRWFLEIVESHTRLRREQRAVAQFALVPDLDQAGARGVAIAAMEALRPR